MFMDLNRFCLANFVATHTPKWSYHGPLLNIVPELVITTVRDDGVQKYLLIHPDQHSTFDFHLHWHLLTHDLTALPLQKYIAVTMCIHINNVRPHVLVIINTELLDN